MKTATGTVTGIDTLASGYGFGLARPGARPVYLTGTDARMRTTLEIARRYRIAVTMDYEPGTGRLGSPDGAVTHLHENQDDALLPMAA